MQRLNTTLFMMLLILCSAPARADFTHLNIDHREMIHLTFSQGYTSIACNSFSDGAFRIKQTGGATTPKEYQVPAGKELIITDIIWGAVPEPALEWIAERGLEVALNAHSETGSAIGRIIALPIVNTPAGDSRSYQGGSVHLTGGVRVASRRYLCPSAAQIYDAGDSSGSATSSVQRMEIFGYLIDKSN